MITINGCRIGKKGIRDTRGNYYPVRFDRGELISTKADAVTIRAKSTLAGLPRELFPQNDSDSREDYFERDRARFHAGSPEYTALLPFCS